MKNPLFLAVMLTLFTGCSKTDMQLPVNKTEPTAVPSEFTNYRILQGNHYCDFSAIKAVNLTQQNFRVKFDSTAVYKTLTLDNQYDINKIFGFTEGSDPHKNSARIGWSYNDDSLRLYGYVYANSTLTTQQISTHRIGEVISCSIKPYQSHYIFSVNDKSIMLERGLLSDTAIGYQLYPYFGGDETAPHTINIFISSVSGK